MVINKSGLVWRIILVVAMGLATTMTLLGAVGTACVAWNGQFYGAAYKWIVPYMPTYQNFVYVSLVAGVAMTLVCYAIARGDKWFYIGGLITLLVGGGAAATQMYYNLLPKRYSVPRHAANEHSIFYHAGHADSFCDRACPRHLEHA